MNKKIEKENEEIWKTFQDLEISSMGRVKRYGIVYSGTPHSHGYMKLFIKADGRTAKTSIGVHRLMGHVFLDLDLKRSDLMVDHINGIKTDNRLENLRIVTQRENQCNQKCHRDGKLAGVGWAKKSSRWIARIRINGKLKQLGYYDTAECAHLAYLGEKAKLFGGEK